MAEKLGIKETKEAAIALMHLANATDAATKDGLDVADIAKYIEPLMKLPAAVDGADLIPAELKDLDSAELAELHATVKAEFKIADDKLELFIEDALEAGVRIFSLVQRFKALREEDAA